MPQGKLKVKVKLPGLAKTKQKKVTKGPAITKRNNRPVVSKKVVHLEADKIKKTITKNLNQANEDEMRDRALDGKKSLLSKGEQMSGGAISNKQKKVKNNKS